MVLLAVSFFPEITLFQARLRTPQYETMPRMSGVQKEVLSLYRNFIRAAKTKPDPTRALTVVCGRFRHDAESIKRMDFRKIEFKMRQGKKHLKLLQSPNVVNIDGYFVPPPSPAP